MTLTKELLETVSFLFLSKTRKTKEIRDKRLNKFAELLGYKTPLTNGSLFYWRLQDKVIPYEKSKEIMKYLDDLEVVQIMARKPVVKGKINNEPKKFVAVAKIGDTMFDDLYRNIVFDN